MQTVLKRFLEVLVLSILFSLMPADAHADNVAAGDYVRFSNRPGSPGGEFLLTAYDAPGGDVIDQFITFCLQMTEYMDFQSTFEVQSVSNASDDLPVADVLDPRTAYLYTQFRNGSLAGYNYGPNGTGDANSADLLQRAIWHFEGEAAGNQTANPFVIAANEAINLGLWSGLGNVRVLNLFFRSGARAQDQLTLVPEPATLVLVGSGLAGLALRRRRTAA